MLPDRGYNVVLGRIQGVDAVKLECMPHHVV